MAAKGAAHRLRIELRRFNDDPTPYFVARPLEHDILEWRFVMQGAPETPYEGGYYHGKIVFPPEYPWKPPAIQMITPSGRFKTNTRICLSISDFHPETWCASWTVSTILTGIISFFNSEESTVGSLSDSVETRRQYASQSIAFNLKDRVFVELFTADPAKMFQDIHPRSSAAAAAATAADGGIKDKAGEPAPAPAAVPAPAEGSTGLGTVFEGLKIDK